MLLAQINQSADFQHEGDAQEVTLCLTESVGIADGDQSMDTVSLQAVTLSDGSTAYIPHNTQESNIVEGQVIQLEDGSSAYVQHIDVQKADESNNWTGSSVCDVVGNESLLLEDARTVQLEDGTTAYIHHTGKDTYEPSTLQAVQLEDGSTAYIHHAVQVSQPNTILAIQTNGTVADLHTEAAIDQETINALEQYTTKIEEIDSYTNSELITSDPHGLVEMQIVLQDQGVRRNAQQPGEKCFQCNYDGCGKLYTTANHLKVHERAHTGDKPYCCDLPGCGKKFATGNKNTSTARVQYIYIDYKLQKISISSKCCLFFSPEKSVLWYPQKYEAAQLFIHYITIIYNNSLTNVSCAANHHIRS